MTKYIVTTHCVYERKVYIEADNQAIAAEEVSNGEGLQIGLPKLVKHVLEVKDVQETDMEV